MFANILPLKCAQETSKMHLFWSKESFFNKIFCFDQQFMSKLTFFAVVVFVIIRRHHYFRKCKAILILVIRIREFFFSKLMCYKNLRHITSVTIIFYSFTFFYHLSKCNRYLFSQFLFWYISLNISLDKHLHFSLF